MGRGEELKSLKRLMAVIIPGSVPLSVSLSASSADGGVGALVRVNSELLSN